MSRFGSCNQSENYGYVIFAAKFVTVIAAAVSADVPASTVSAIFAV